MHVVGTALAEVKIVEPDSFGDQRGALVQLWDATQHEKHGLLTSCVLDLVSLSSRGVVRGLHYQQPFGQAKLISVLDGEVFDVAVDLRVGSPSFGRWASAILSSDNRRQFFIPKGFAHGFAVLSERATLHYKLDEHYHPETEAGVAWNDPDLAIDWPEIVPVVSKRDSQLPRLRDVERAQLPQFSKSVR